MPPSQQAAALELLRRRKARNSLIGYSNTIEVPGRPISDDPDEWLFHPVESSVALHHRLLLETAQNIVTTPYGRGMFLLPPGSAKSTYGSVVLPTWCMGRTPGYRMILASYGSDLARKHGRRARQIVRQRKFRGVFGADLSAQSSAADEWALTNGSEYMAAGILQGITGNRANGIVIDDPVKGREEADSEVIRKRTKEAYEDDLKTRLLPGGWMIIIQTRWHEDDLAGSILPENWQGESGLIRCRDGFDWYVLCLPAKCERPDDPLGRKVGEYIWPEWFGPKHWAQFENNPRTWSALYQQRPTPDTGAYFKREWFTKRYTGTPTPAWARKLGLRIYGASDYATKDGEGDWTVHVVIGLDADDNIYILDLWRGQATSDVWVETFCDLVLLWQPQTWGEPNDQIKKSVGPFLEKRMRERQAYCHRELISEQGDKRSKARGFQARASMGKVILPEIAPWLADLIHELLVFDAGKNDDQVDALSIIGRMLDSMVGGSIPKSGRKKSDLWDEAFGELDDSETPSWKVA